MTITLTPDQIVSGLVGFFTVSGAVVYGLKKNGIVSFGTPKERRKCGDPCPEHKQVIESIAVLFNKFDGIDKKLDTVSETVQHIAGYLEGTRSRGR
jgi:hypothetical protein